MKARAKRGEGAALAMHPLSLAPLPSHAALLASGPRGCRWPRGHPASPSHMPSRAAGKAPYKTRARGFKSVYWETVTAFGVFFLDPPTLTWQANKGPPAAPQHVAISAAPCQLPAAGTNAHLHLESRDQVEEKGWHCIQGVRLVWKVDLAWDQPIMPHFKSHCTLESKDWVLLLVGRKNTSLIWSLFNRFSRLYLMWQLAVHFTSERCMSSSWVQAITLSFSEWQTCIHQAPTPAGWKHWEFTSTVTFFGCRPLSVSKG